MKPEEKLLRAEQLISIQKDIANELSITLNLDAALDVFLKNLLRIPGLHGGGVFVFRENGSLYLQKYAGLDESYISGLSDWIEGSPECQIVKNRSIVSFSRTAGNEPEFQVFNKMPAVSSFIVVPVKLNMEIVAALLLVSNTYTSIDQVILDTVETASAKIGGIIGRIDFEGLIQEHVNNFESVYTSIHDVLIIVNSEGKIIHFNPLAPLRFGYPDEEFADLHIRDLHIPEIQGEVLGLISEALAGNQLLSLYPFVSATGDVIPSETTFSLVRWSGRKMVLLVSRDLRERYAAEEEITLARRKAEEANRAKSVFLANMSHAFRIPMNSIIGMSELMLKTDLTKKQFNFVNVIIKSAENLMVIVNDLLDISRIEAGEMSLMKKTFAVKDVLTSVINNQFYQVQDKGVELLSDYVTYGEDYHVIGDPVRLNQVMLNLVENAIKHTEKGKVEIKVVAEEESDTEIRLRFHVIDTGSGISKKRLVEIQESFLNNQPLFQPHGGSGLGLVISNRLIDIMGGHLAITSEEEKGAEFSFCLKFKKGIEKGNDSKMAEKSAVIPADMDNVRVLLAEDQVFNQMVVQSMVEEWGFEIDIVENGRQALQQLKTKKYDVVLMDIQMPEMDGVEATRQIRTNLEKPLCDIPIIAITANAYIRDHKMYLETGMNDTISKPFKSQVLFHKIANCLGVSKSNIHAAGTSGHDMDIIVQPKEEKLYDLSVVSGISKGNKQVIQKMLEVFIEKASEEMAMLKVYHSSQNWAMLATTAHKMKPALAYLGMRALEARVNEIQRIAREQVNLDKMPQYLQSLENMLNKVMVALKEELPGKDDK